MVSLAALVLTITMVVVQLAMGQFSPRIVQPILKDKPSQFAIGIFVGTFAFAMLAMRQVIIGSAGPGQVPGLTVVVAFVLVVVSIAVLVLYVHHIGRSLRVSSPTISMRAATRRACPMWCTYMTSTAMLMRTSTNAVTTEIPGT